MGASEAIVNVVYGVQEDRDDCSGRTSRLEIEKCQCGSRSRVAGRVENHTQRFLVYFSASSISTIQSLYCSQLVPSRYIVSPLIF